MTVGILLAYLCFLFVVAAVAERFGRRRLVSRLRTLTGSRPTAASSS